MSFNSNEASSFDGQPVILYEFYRRSGDLDLYWRYNSTDQNIVVLSGATYLPTPISDDGVKQDGEATNSELNITMPVTDDFPAMFRTAGATPSDTVYITLRKIHFNDFHAIGVWSTNTNIGTGTGSVLALASGVSMFPGDSVASPSGEFILTFQMDGNVVLIQNGTNVLWNTGTVGQGAVLTMQEDGNLVLYDGVGNALVATDTAVPQVTLSTGRYLQLQDDGNLVIYTVPVPDPRVIWVGTIAGMAQLDEIRVKITCATLIASFKRGGLRLSWTRGCPHALYDSQCKMVPADFQINAEIDSLTGNSIVANELAALPDGYFNGGYIEWNLSPALWATGTDVSAGTGRKVVLASGASMVPGDSISSLSNEFVLQFQFDGNVVLLQGSTVLWTTNTTDGIALIMQSDGNLVVYNDLTAVWSSNTAGNFGAHLDLQDDGNLAIYPLHPRLSGIVERRGIRTHSGDTVILAGSTFGLVVSQSAKFFPGCRRIRVDCNDKFNNILNYGGFPDTPGKSPYSGDPVF